MKIGFYGDSFCCEVDNPHNLFHGYETFITKIKKYYNAEIVSLGIGGSSYWDLILKQFDKDNFPDVCVFFWTNHYRIYHPKVRNLTFGTVRNIKLKDYKLSHLLHHNTYKAAEKYFDYLYDETKSKEEMISALYRFDREVLSKMTHTNIIHAWCFENLYNWENGKTIPIILKDLVGDSSDMAPNHLQGNDKNEFLCKLLIQTINAR